VKVSIRINDQLVTFDADPDASVEILVNDRPVLGIIDTASDGVLFGHWPDGTNWESLTDLLGGAS
jgi:hypothetical protein